MQLFHLKDFYPFLQYPPLYFLHYTVSIKTSPLDDNNLYSSLITSYRMHFLGIHVQVQTNGSLCSICSRFQWWGYHIRSICFFFIWVCNFNYFYYVFFVFFLYIFHNQFLKYNWVLGDFYIQQNLFNFLIFFFFFDIIFVYIYLKFYILIFPI